MLLYCLFPVQVGTVAIISTVLENKPRFSRYWVLLDARLAPWVRNCGHRPADHTGEAGAAIATVSSFSQVLDAALG